MSSSSLSRSFRRAVALVAGLNIAYFGVEFVVALRIDSVSLFADSVDFLEDTSINLLILLASYWSPLWRSRIGRFLAIILLVPTVAAFWATWNKLASPIPPGAFALTVTGVGALAVNLTCAFLLARHRHSAGSLTKAAWLSARNDALANVAIIFAGFLTAMTLSAWPDLVVGLGIAALNAGAAREVWIQAAAERAGTARA